MKLCSACLLGVECRYDGEHNRNEKVLELAKKETLIPVCPEQLGGLATPRVKAEIREGGVVNAENEDVTRQFKKGAEETLRIAKTFGAKEAILKQRSPSCGCGKVYDGTFSKTLVSGDGITTKLLKENGVVVKTEEDL